MYFENQVTSCNDKAVIDMYEIRYYIKEKLQFVSKDVMQEMNSKAIRVLPLVMLSRGSLKR